MRVALVVPAVVVTLALGACGTGTTESSLTKADVVKKLTVNPPPKGFKRLLKADCKRTKKNRYTCDVLTEDQDRAKLDVRARGDKIEILNARNE
jgi:hypothetical protein